MAYNHQNIEKKWQGFWEKNKTFKTELDFKRKKLYILDMFPYPSASGLHVGHPLGYTATDIYSRYKRLQGYNVLHPIGWDAFGLPAEQYAIKTGTHPKETTKKNIKNFKRQIKQLGLSYDWDREINTTDEKYYKWTQWLFLQLYEKGLAYEAKVPVNWCPVLKAVLANEEVVDGKSDIGGHPVIRKPMRQWMLKITDYAESLLTGLDNLDWPENVKELQRNWIGKSKGANVIFKIESFNHTITIFTTRPDTLFGATYIVLAPEHPLVKKLVSSSQKAIVEKYIKDSERKSDLERGELEKEKSGVSLGVYAINPVNNEKIPIWIADYVLMSYGTGAIMAVPAHDQRDYEFAKKYNIKISEVVRGGDVSKEAFTDNQNGVMINSSNEDDLNLNGLIVPEAIQSTIKWLEVRKKGNSKIQYKLRDWLFSRQRYWGEPIPIIHTPDGNIETINESDLPLCLPDIEKYQPTDTGESPLGNIKEWVNSETGRRETNTMPQWAGSCWYFLRFLDPKNDSKAWGEKEEKYWMPVDLYVGGVEHAVLHLLYSRFWHHVFYDLGLVSTKEPFKKLYNQGMIRGEDGFKMSKSRGNVINPDKVVSEYGADSFRLYEMFMGPLDKSKPWNTKGLQGCYRFLQKVWKKFNQSSKPVFGNTTDNETNVLLNRTIKRVTEDLNDLKFNTCVSHLMILANHLVLLEAVEKKVIFKFLQLLNPFAPHITEEIAENLQLQPIHSSKWPSYDEKVIFNKDTTIGVQIDGKTRGSINIEVGMDQERILEMVLLSKNFDNYLKSESSVKKVIYIKERVLNILTQ